MAGRNRNSYLCSNCGAATTSWEGRCSNCGEWNTIIEQVVSFSGKSHKSGVGLVPKPISDALAKDEKRYIIGVSEIDMVLGGGLVAGSVSLIAGQPGIGKSTLLLQLAQSLASNHEILYVSGEESEHQIGLRATRLGVTSKALHLAHANSSEDIQATILSKKYRIVVVDSIQTLVCDGVSSLPGSVSQITNSVQLLIEAAKRSNTALILVGHVTKEGSIAGPKVLEHLVDVVLDLEGDRYGGFKVLRAVKNRSGSRRQPVCYTSS
jgi:DNA repair protein RadA/Sms